MNEDFVPYKSAVKLRKCGFEWGYNHVNPMCTAIPLWQAQKWLREVKGVIITVTPETDMSDFNDIPKDFLTGEWCYDIWLGNDVHRYFMGSYPSYEQALSEGISMALELIEKKGE